MGGVLASPNQGRISARMLRDTGTLGTVTRAAFFGTQSAATGRLNATLGALTLSATGNAPATAALSKTLGALTLSATAQAIAIGALTRTLGALTLAATGSGVSPATGSLTATLGPLTLAASAQAVATGACAKTLSPLTLTGSALAVATGQLVRTLGALTLSAIGNPAAPIVAAPYKPEVLAFSRIHLKVDLRKTATGGDCDMFWNDSGVTITGAPEPQSDGSAVDLTGSMVLVTIGPADGSSPGVVRSGQLSTDKTSGVYVNQGDEFSAGGGAYVVQMRFENGQRRLTSQATIKVGHAYDEDGNWK